METIEQKTKKLKREKQTQDEQTLLFKTLRKIVDTCCTKEKERLLKKVRRHSRNLGKKLDMYEQKNLLNKIVALFPFFLKEVTGTVDYITNISEFGFDLNCLDEESSRESFKEIADILEAVKTDTVSDSYFRLYDRIYKDWQKACKEGRLQTLKKYLAFGFGVKDFPEFAKKIHGFYNPSLIHQMARYYPNTLLFELFPILQKQFELEPSSKDSFGRTIVNLIALENPDKLMGFLEEMKNNHFLNFASLADNNGYQIIHNLANSHPEKLLEFLPDLVEKFGVDINSSTKTGLTVPHILVLRHPVFFGQNIQWLKKFDTNFQGLTDDGETILYCLTVRHPQLYPDMTPIIVEECGVDPNISNKNGFSPIHTLLEHGVKFFLQSLEALKRTGTDFTQRDCYGQSVLKRIMDPDFTSPLFPKDLFTVFIEKKIDIGQMYKNEEDRETKQRVRKLTKKFYSEPLTSKIRELKKILLIDQKDKKRVKFLFSEISALTGYLSEIGLLFLCKKEIQEIQKMKELFRHGTRPVDQESVYLGGFQDIV